MHSLPIKSKCPKCDFQAIAPETEQIFYCPECRYESCRRCGEAAHIPFRCEEVEKKGETSARLRVEEAMTIARIRRCPNGCKQPFFKVEGCNKMTCPICRSFICYICQQIIPKSVGYKHFCQTPHCTHEKCGKCTLYSNTEEDDKRAAKEAGRKVMEEVRQEEIVKHGENSCNGITKRLNIDQLMYSPSSKNQNSNAGICPRKVPIGAIRHQQAMDAIYRRELERRSHREMEVSSFQERWRNGSKR